MNGCVNKNKEFYSLAKEHGIDGGELELIIHKYWNEGGKVDSFPSTLYISEQLGIGKTYYESGENVRKLWEKDYSEPIIVNSESELSASVAKAKTFFPADAITTYKDNKGNFVLRVTEPVTSSSINKEMQDILATAPRDSQGRLLAPNGKVSNLTEKQYAQVRTKAFKNWFGDWENDPANASKVIDENGEPLVVYHGSKSIFTVFDSSKSESRQYLSQQIKPTNFFSSDKTVADFFALTENQSLASQISKSIDITLDAFAGENIDEDILYDEIWTDAANRTGKSKEFVKDFWENKVPREYKKHDEFGTTKMEDPDINKYKYNIFLNMKNPIILDAKGERADKFIEANKEVLNNNDEVIILNINETVGKEDAATDYLVRNSNQIKSATDNIGTFDANNPDIRYREASITLEDIYKYHQEKLDYSNLDNTQKTLLEDRGISEEQYSFLTQAEKENLRMCLV